MSVREGKIEIVSKEKEREREGGGGAEISRGWGV